MTLDPQARALLDLQAITGFRGYDQLPIAEARALMRTRALEIPREEVGRLENRTIDSGVPIRIYWPATDDRVRPALVFYHGGGWVLGDLENVDPTCRRLANETGFVVISVDYRLAPEHPFPDGVEDACEAFDWVLRESDLLKINPAKVAVGGDSAGGNLALVVSMIARDQRTTIPGFQLLVYPVTHYNFDTSSYHEFAEGFGLTRSAMEYYWNHYLQDPAKGALPYASPLRGDLRGLPKTLIITAECDPLRDDGEQLAVMLQRAEVDCQLLRVDGQIHGFFHLGHVMDKGRMAVADAAKALLSAFTE